jgi:ketosteroid isomerase-like protein
MLDAAAIFRTLIAGFDAGDGAAMRAVLADDVVAYVTNADGGVDRVVGRDAYMERMPDVSGAEYSVSTTQVVTVDDTHALGMVEVKAERKGKSLLNHSAFLVRADAGAAREIWMVEALPAYSDEFWS